MTSTDIENIKNDLRILIDHAQNREDFWTGLVNLYKLRKILEIGVFKGDFAVVLLEKCHSIRKYYMIDPWKYLEQWEKPLNMGDLEFEQVYNEMLRRTALAARKRIILRGTTSEMIHHVRSRSLDMVYIDGDHTLRGITIDLISAWVKVKPGGIIGGDDFAESIWQHPKNYEPTMIFPYAVHFAEAHHAEIMALPFNQFLILKSNTGFKFHDFTGKYSNTGLLKLIRALYDSKQ